MKDKRKIHSTFCTYCILETSISNVRDKMSLTLELNTLTTTVSNMSMSQTDGQTDRQAAAMCVTKQVTIRYGTILCI